MTAREAVMLQNGGSVLGNVIDQGNDLEFDDQKHQQPGVFVQGTMNPLKCWGSYYISTSFLRRNENQRL